MHIHMLGICGTFMGSIAQLAKQLGHTVTGCDSQVYPPMSHQLENAGIELIEGYHSGQLNPSPDLVVIGNALSRGNPCVEYVLDHRIPYVSGPQWLGETVLANRHVLAVAGTHGKTTTSSMLTFILQSAGLDPGYLIGGIPINTGSSADLGAGEYFVIEADEYDSAFFDKRSKFLHYHTKTLLINNIEYDHADIFDDLQAIKTQFHHLLRTLPSSGAVVFPSGDKVINSVLGRGCWSQKICYGVNEGDWQYRVLDQNSQFEIMNRETDSIDQPYVNWELNGLHNVLNGVAAIVAAHHVGISVEQSCEILSGFAGVKRRMETLYDEGGFVLYDDFAHHPTAIEATLTALRDKVGDSRVVAVIEPRSASMRLGVHLERLGQSVGLADHVIWHLDDNIKWDIHQNMLGTDVRYEVTNQIESLVEKCLCLAQSETHMVIMSNGGFTGLRELLMERLKD